MVYQKFWYANTLGQDHVSQRWRNFTFMGPHNNFFRKKTCFLNNLSLDHIAFEHLSLYIQRRLPIVNIADSIIFCSREFFCTTLRSCWRLYWKHCEASAMINFIKELPQNTTVAKSDHTEQYSKIPMTAPSRDSLWYPQWIKTSSGACLGQHLGHIVNNGHQSAVLHLLCVPHTVCVCFRCSGSIAHPWRLGSHGLSAWRVQRTKPRGPKGL